MQLFRSVIRIPSRCTVLASLLKSMKFDKRETLPRFSPEEILSVSYATHHFGGIGWKEWADRRTCTMNYIFVTNLHIFVF